MKFAGILLMVGAVAAGRLEKTYLPPGSAATAGGAGFVQAPGFSSNHVATIPGFNTGSYQGNQESGSFSGYNSASYQGNQGSGSFPGHKGSYQGNQGGQIDITRYDNQNNGDGQYQYNYETANGISAQEAGNDKGASGSYSYTGPDGVLYTIRYTADENGFHAEGDHLPTPPPIPEEIRRGVELSLAAEARGENQDGGYHSEHQQNFNQYQGTVSANGGYHY